MVDAMFENAFPSRGLIGQEFSAYQSTQNRARIRFIFLGNLEIGQLLGQMEKAARRGSCRRAFIRQPGVRFLPIVWRATVRWGARKVKIRACLGGGQQARVS